VGYEPPGAERVHCLRHAVKVAPKALRRRSVHHARSVPSIAYAIWTLNTAVQ
jgi:hypothetical protein